MDYQPDEQELEVLDVLREEGRANPMLLREKTDLRKEYVSRALNGLQKAGVVRKVTRGLYEHVPEEDDDYTHEHAPVEVDALRDALDDARDAYENVNGNGVEDALDRMEGLLNDS